jgi:hypothetical protein
MKNLDFCRILQKKIVIAIVPKITAATGLKTPIPTRLYVSTISQVASSPVRDD